MAARAAGAGRHEYVQVRFTFGGGHLDLTSASVKSVNKQIRALDDDHCIATWQGVLIQVWRGATTSAAVRELGQIARAFTAEEGKPICSIAVIERSSPPPADTLRNQLADFYRAANMNVAVVVAEGGGFRGAIVRGVGLTLSTLAPKSLPFKFATTVEEATALIAPHLPPGAGGANGLRRIIDEVRGELPPAKS